MFLLDINILLAVADPEHEHHEKAEAFFLANHRSGWATCPTTENGFVRIISNPKYPKGLATAEAARDVLRQLCASEGHRFLADDISLRSMGNLPGWKHLTDHYLLSLAIQHLGKLVTLDRRINAALIAGGPQAYIVL